MLQGGGCWRGSQLRVCNRDRATDRGREGFVHQPFPTLPFTFCCMATPGLSDMTNRFAFFTEMVAVSESKNGVRWIDVCVQIYRCVCVGGWVGGVSFNLSTWSCQHFPSLVPQISLSLSPGWGRKLNASSSAWADSSVHEPDAATHAHAHMRTHASAQMPAPSCFPKSVQGVTIETLPHEWVALNKAKGVCVYIESVEGERGSSWQGRRPCHHLCPLVKQAIAANDTCMQHALLLHFLLC